MDVCCRHGDIDKQLHDCLSNPLLPCLECILVCYLKIFSMLQFSCVTSCSLVMSVCSQTDYIKYISIFMMWNVFVPWGGSSNSRMWGATFPIIPPIHFSSLPFLLVPPSNLLSFFLFLPWSGLLNPARSHWWDPKKQFWHIWSPWKESGGKDLGSSGVKFIIFQNALINSIQVGILKERERWVCCCLVPPMVPVRQADNICLWAEVVCDWCVRLWSCVIDWQASEMSVIFNNSHWDTVVENYGS